MSELAARIASVRARIERAAARAGRAPADIQLLAVAKSVPAARVIEAAAAGLRQFGENRVQEAAHKIPEVDAAGLGRSEWHLIGSLQSNKARRAAELFDVIQSVDRLRVAQLLDRAAGERGRRLRALVQIDLDGEPQKGGVAPAHAAALLEALAALPQLAVEGLMTIPAARPRAEEQRPAFARLRALLLELQRQAPQGAALRELSMGMSGDFEVAIEEGATCVRIGTALFGERGRSET